MIQANAVNRNPLHFRNSMRPCHISQTAIPWFAGAFAPHQYQMLYIHYTGMSLIMKSCDKSSYFLQNSGTNRMMTV